MKLSLVLIEGVESNTIFAWPFLQTIKASIMTENNTLVSGLLEDKFKLDMMVPQRAKDAPKHQIDLQFYFKSQSKVNKITLRTEALLIVRWN